MIAATNMCSLRYREIQDSPGPVPAGTKRDTAPLETENCPTRRPDSFVLCLAPEAGEKGRGVAKLLNAQLD